MKINVNDVNDIHHKYNKIVTSKNDRFLNIHMQNEIFDEFGNYKMPNYFEFIEINSAIQKHK